MATRSTRGVIVTVYEESSASRLNPAVKLIERSRLSRKCSSSARSNAYDRRSRLLAYAHELRNSVDGPDWADWNSEPVPKQSEKCGSKWKRFRISFLQSFRANKTQWNYERVGTDQNNSGRPMRQKAYGRSRNKFMDNLKRLLKGLSFGWNCNGNCNRSEMSQY